MSDSTLIAVLCIFGGLALGVLVTLMSRRNGGADPQSAQSIAQLHTRLDDMGKWLSGAHGQLQQTVNSRLDAVTQNLGTTLQSANKQTTDHLQQLHARLAVIDSAQK